MLSREGTPEYNNIILFFKLENEFEFENVLLGKEDGVMISNIVFKEICIFL